MEVDGSTAREVEADHLAAGLDDAFVWAGAEFQDGQIVLRGHPDVDRVGFALAQGLVEPVASAGVLAVGGLVGVREYVADGGDPSWAVSPNRSFPTEPWHQQITWR